MNQSTMIVIGYFVTVIQTGKQRQMNSVDITMEAFTKSARQALDNVCPGHSKLTEAVT